MPAAMGAGAGIRAPRGAWCRHLARALDADLAERLEVGGDVLLRHREDAVRRLDQRLLRGVEVDLVLDRAAGALEPGILPLRRPGGGIDEVLLPALARRLQPGDQL